MVENLFFLAFSIVRPFNTERVLKGDKESGVNLVLQYMINQVLITYITIEKINFS